LHYEHENEDIALARKLQEEDEQEARREH